MVKVSQNIWFSRGTVEEQVDFYVGMMIKIGVIYTYSIQKNVSLFQI